MNDEKLWHIEEQFWLAGADFYDQHLCANALMVLPPPTGVLDRPATLDAIQQGHRWERATFEKRRFARPASDVAVLAYSAIALRDSGPAYRAICSSTYVKVGEAWLLALHQQTPHD